MGLVRIEVKQEHIDKGIPGRCFSCPIALAALAVLPAREFHVQVSRACLGFRWARAFYLPESARHFVKMFDDGEDVTPFDFEIEIPGLGE